MKILQIVTQEEAGGAQAVAVRLGEALRERGHEAEVWFLYRKRAAYADYPGVHALFLERPRGLDYLTIARRVLTGIRRFRPDAVIAHTHYANAVGLALAACAGTRARIAVHHNPLHTYPRLARLLDRLVGNAGFYTGMVAVSNTVMESAANRPSRYRRRMKLVYNGVPVEPIAASEQGMKERLGIPVGVPLLANVGRLAPQKNQAFLLEVMQHLPDVRLALAGDGELHDQLRDKCKRLNLTERVHFLGEVKNKDVQLLLRSADVFVFPSLYEAMPLALLEAMHAGVPIVASDIPANREILDDAGILLGQTPQDFADAVLRVLGHREIGAALGAHACERAKQFTMEGMVDGYELLLGAR